MKSIVNILINLVLKHLEYSIIENQEKEKKRIKYVGLKLVCLGGLFWQKQSFLSMLPSKTGWEAEEKVRGLRNNSMTHGLKDKLVVFRTPPWALYGWKAGPLISIYHSVTPLFSLTKGSQWPNMHESLGAVCVCLCWLVGEHLLFPVHSSGSHLHKKRIFPTAHIYHLLISYVCNAGKRISLDSLNYPTLSREGQSHSGHWALWNRHQKSSCVRNEKRRVMHLATHLPCLSSRLGTTSVF